MGAHTFQTTMGGKNMTAGEAYTEACKGAEWEDGHDSYNGTISTTSGHRMIECGRRSINALIDSVLDDEDSPIQKWGPAGCIELKRARLRDWKKANGFLGKRDIRAFVFFGWAAS